MIDEANRIKGWTEPWTQIEGRVRSLGEMLELLEGDQDAELLAEVAAEAERWPRCWPTWSCATCCRGPTTGAMRWSPSTPAPAAPRARTGPRCSCACTRAGPSGTGFEVELLDLQEGDEAGIKDATLEITRRSTPTAT